MPPTLRLRTLTLLAAVTLCACAAAQTVESLGPFTTDGCSMFPDRSALSKADWCSCCVVHDLAYWRGGTAQERLEADKGLQACVLRASGNAALADLMFAGVRSGGGPYFYTPYRWAYGWSYGRGYKPLSAEESALASSLKAQYLATNPSPVCAKLTAGHGACDDGYLIGASSSGAVTSGRTPWE